MVSFFRGIRARIIKIPLVGALGLALMTGLSMYILATTMNTMNSLLEVRLKSAIYWGALQQNLYSLEFHIKKAANFPNDLQKVKENLDETKKHAAAVVDSTKGFEVIKQLGNPKIDSIYKDFPQKLENLLKKYNDLAISIERAPRPVQTQEASQWYQALMGPLSDDLQELNDIFEDMNTARVELSQMTISGIQTNKNMYLSFFMAAGILGFLLVLGVGLWIGESLVKELMSINENLGEASDQVATASQVLSHSSQKVSVAASEGAASLEESVSSIEELSSMVKQNADHAREANALSLTARGAAEVGEGEIKNLLQAMDEISDSSRKIEEITAVIDNIAFQTNLLALNAAVEAARAGEQGKGFAVVAEAVRNLAQRSSAAAKDINGLIKESVEKSTKGVHIAQKCGDNLKDIVNNAKRVADLIAEIASASQEQAHGVAQISKAMNHLDQVTQTNAATAEESAAASEEMAAQAESLGQLLTGLRSVILGDGVPASKEKRLSPPGPRGGRKAPERISKTPITAAPSRAPLRATAKAPGAGPASGAHLIPFDSDEMDPPSQDRKISNVGQF